MIYSNRLKELRTINKLSQSDTAKIIEVKQNAYSQYESEYVIIPIKHLNILCNYFNASIDYIFSFTNVKCYSNYKENIDRIEVGKRIKEFRKDNNLTQIKLANFLNIANGTIADYETGRRLIATPFLYTICSKYNISADYLLGKIDEPKYLK